MVKPVHLQDNLSKTWLAQEAMEKMLEGSEKARDHQKLAAQQQLEEDARNKIADADEKSGASRVSSEDKRRREKGSSRKRGRNQRAGANGEDSEAETDLRLRNKKDDEGKGSRIDIKG